LFNWYGFKQNTNYLSVTELILLGKRNRVACIPEWGFQAKTNETSKAIKYFISSQMKRKSKYIKTKKEQKKRVKLPPVYRN